MILKVEVAADARRSDDFLIIARTDARTTLGLDEAIRRGCLCARAGADIVFIESPESEEEMARICGEVDAPLLANMVEGGRTPLLSADRLKALGYAIAIFPATGFLAMAAAMERVYMELRTHGGTAGIDRSDDYGFARMCTLMNFPEHWNFESKWAARGREVDSQIG